MNSKADEAYNIIKNKIINLELYPLSDLSEEEFQKELNISRTPVREAIQKLAKEGFVRIYSRKATIVSDITLDLINSVYEVRLLNEPYLAKLAYHHVSDKQVQRLKEEFLQLMDECESRDNREYYIALDKELHDMMIQYSNNPFLQDLFGVINDHNQRIRIQTSRRNTSYHKSIEEHLKILEAYEKRDGEAIENLVREHIQNAKKEAFEFYA
ncbi:MAG: GntR family transcriptional regulator [Lachnospiraceae bacterium]|nr:GntR family transcriptional regulator [Lachnospiraceae bacterium]